MKRTFWHVRPMHYENMPIQIYWRFYRQKKKKKKKKKKKNENFQKFSDKKFW